MGVPKKRLQYRYDAAGNRTGLTDPDGGRFTYSYDVMNRLTQAVNPQGQRTSYSYDALGRRTLKRLSNGTRTSFSYDAASRLTSLFHLKSDGTVLSSFRYRYDNAGNRTGVTEADGSRVTWSYDATYQLTGEHRTGTTPYRHTFTYDSRGNRTLKNENGQRTTYAYDAANQLRYSQASAGRTTYTFDADGNQQAQREPSGQRTTSTWDFENRMTSERRPDGGRSTMAYDPEGLRVSLEDATGVKKFVWDEQNYLAETDGADDTQVVYTNEPNTYGNLISQRRGATTNWYHFDAIGSTRQLTNSSAAVTDTRLYDAWGVELTQSGTSVFPFGYVGELGYYADASGRVYVRARHLNPLRASWLSMDPLWKTLRSMLYVYATARPLNMIDPSGLACSDIMWWTPDDCRACPSCKCTDVHRESRELPENYPLGEVGHGIQQNDLKLNFHKCSISYRIADCGLPLPDSGRTCARGTKKNSREIVICIQKGTSLCVARELLVHELMHAYYYCQQDDGAAGPGTDARPCGEQELSPYRASCKAALAQRCVAATDDNYNKQLSDCIDKGQAISCVTLPAKATKTCDDIFSIFDGVAPAGK